MAESLNYQQIQRRAWTIMIAALVTFCVLVISIPLGINWFLHNSETTQETSVTLISGTVLLTQPGDTLPQAIVETVSGLVESAQIDTEAGSQAAVSFYAPDKTTALGSLQIYSGSSIDLSLMRSPRFEWSDRPHRMVINMQRGRARVSLAVDVKRPIVILLKTPHGEVLLERSGSYSIEVTPHTTEVVVRDDAATVTGAGESVILAAGERTTVCAGCKPAGVLTGERNLVVNGDFASPLSPADWSPYKDRYDPTDVEGQIEMTVDAGRKAVHFIRPGSNWGRVGIQQKINRDVRDYQSLKLHLAVRLIRQNLSMCGSMGSECPLMVKIEYTDLAGSKNEWVQGFYYYNDSGSNLPPLCVACSSPKSNHIRVQHSVWYAYDIDLLALFKSANRTPAVINTISIYAEGHTFESLVSEIELLAGD
ncbi:MAG TPA: hypothetical protein VJL59_03140 [Anaerolineales bacterium]|nr:hypothetical protein [Anaerolineales bacterium]